jgi:endoglucanase
MKMIQSILILSIWSGAALAANTPKNARTARVDFSADVELDNGVLTTGKGYFNRFGWLPTAYEQSKTFTVEASIQTFRWTPISFQFTARYNGTVTMTLRGPWELNSANNAIFQEEVWWDSISAVNATIQNGGFELVSGTTFPGWSGAAPSGTSGSPIPAATVGSARYARVWHDQPLQQSFYMSAGIPVTVTLYAREYLTPGVPQLSPVAGTNTAAHQAAKNFLRGVNLDGYLDAPPNTWGNVRYSAADFAEMRNEGFDHVRIPVGWHFYSGAAPAYTIDPAAFTAADNLVNLALARGLNAIIDFHSFSEFTDPSSIPANEQRFYKVWEQVAAHYASRPASVAFELLNEPGWFSDATTLMSTYYAEAIKRIRVTNPNRTIFLGPAFANDSWELDALRLPQTDTNIIVTLHDYDPFFFTHQGASWAGPDLATRPIFFPGPPSQPVTPAAGVSDSVVNWIQRYNTNPPATNPSSPIAFSETIRLGSEWSKYYGRPVHYGEWGAYAGEDGITGGADGASRANFHRAFRSLLDQYRLGWAKWGWKSSFPYVNEPTGGSFVPAPLAMRDALFPLNPIGASAYNIGGVGFGGGAMVTDDPAARRLTVWGSGVDIGGTNDSFSMAGETLTGNGEILAKVASVQNTDPQAKAGVMMRDSLAPNAKNVFLLVSKSSSYALQSRAATGGNTARTGGGACTSCFVKLVRDGNVFSAYTSSDGAVWAKAGNAQTVAMGNTIYAGFAVTSRNNKALNQSEFEIVGIYPRP